jgi:hypothetical protein
MKDLFEENKIDWQTIDEYEKEGNFASLCMALAESDKLLNYILVTQGYRGDNIFEKIREAKNRFTDLHGLASGLEIKESIFEEYDKEVSKDDVEKAIKHYKQAIKDLSENDQPDTGLLEKINAWIDFHFIYNRGFFRRLIIWFVSIIFSLIVLDTTHPGQALAHFFVNLVFKVSNFLVIFGIAVGALFLIIIGFVIYFEKRKKKK